MTAESLSVSIWLVFMFSVFWTEPLADVKTSQSRFQEFNFVCLGRQSLLESK